MYFTFFLSSLTCVVVSLSVTAVKEHLKETGGLKGCHEGVFIPDAAKALTLPCDVLIPAALEGNILEPILDSKRQK